MGNLIGEVKTDRQLNKKCSYHKFIWQVCIGCGERRWVRLCNGVPISINCRKCNPPRRGAQVGSWKGGRKKDKNGYISIKVYPEDFFFHMANAGGYVLEHRLVVAKALERCLLPWEIVHHKGKKYPQSSKENRSDNRYPENLELLSSTKRHLPSMKVQAELRKRDKRIAQLEQRVTLLEAENILFRETQGVFNDAR